MAVLDFLRQRPPRRNPPPSAAWRVEFRRAEGGDWQPLDAFSDEATAWDEAAAPRATGEPGDLVRLLAPGGLTVGFWVTRPDGPADAGPVPVALQGPPVMIYSDVREVGAPGRRLSLRKHERRVAAARRAVDARAVDWAAAWEGDGPAAAMLAAATAVDPRRVVLAACALAEYAVPFAPGDGSPEGNGTARRAINAARRAVDGTVDAAGLRASLADVEAERGAVPSAVAALRALASLLRAAAALADDPTRAAARAGEAANAVADAAGNSVAVQAAFAAIVRRYVPLSALLLAREAGDDRLPPWQLQRRVAEGAAWATLGDFDGEGAARRAALRTAALNRAWGPGELVRLVDPGGTVRVTWAVSSGALAEPWAARGAAGLVDGGPVGFSGIPGDRDWTRGWEGRWADPVTMVRACAGVDLRRLARATCDAVELAVARRPPVAEGAAAACGGVLRAVRAWAAGAGWAAGDDDELAVAVGELGGDADAVAVAVGRLAGTLPDRAFDRGDGAGPDPFFDDAAGPDAAAVAALCAGALVAAAGAADGVLAPRAGPEHVRLAVRAMRVAAPAGIDADDRAEVARRVRRHVPVGAVLLAGAGFTWPPEGPR